MPEKDKKNSGGRPKFEITPEICRKAKSLATQGLNLKQIAKVLGIHYDTLNEKKKEFSEFSESIEEGWAGGCAVQVNALFEKGRGYSHPEEKIFCNKDGDITRVETVKHYPPDTAAIMAWLSNKDPENWRIKRDVEHSGNIDHKHEGISRTLEILREFRGERPDQSAEGSLPN